MIKIDKNVPIPTPVRPPKRESKYPFSMMEIGDSFFAPNRKSVTAMSWRRGKDLGRKFSVRAEGKGVRVWRIE